MNELEFKRHLKDLVHGHHHPEEHDWREPGDGPPKTKTTKTRAAKHPAPAKTARKKR